jgi:hypothetical protein
MTTFAVMSLATAQADRRTSEASAKAISDYYEADSQAEKILARLRGGEVPAGVVREGGTYSYSVAVSNTQRLDVQVYRQNGSWRVLRWQEVSTEKWKADTHLNVWDGSDDGGENGWN